MKTCESCRFWARGTADGELCEVSGYGFCLSDKLVDISDSDVALPTTSDCLLYTDSEEYKATCFVGKDFGCVHHEEHE